MFFSKIKSVLPRKRYMVIVTFEYVTNGVDEKDAAMLLMAHIAQNPWIVGNYGDFEVKEMPDDANRKGQI